MSSGVSGRYELTYRNEDNSVIAHIDKIDGKTQAQSMTNAAEGEKANTIADNERLINRTPPDEYEPQENTNNNSDSSGVSEIKSIGGTVPFGGSGGGSVKTSTSKGLIKSRVYDIDSV